jgi:hypothetical protein
VGFNPLLFNIYMDFVDRQAMAQMPEGCGVKLAYHADGKLHSLLDKLQASAYLWNKRKLGVVVCSLVSRCHSVAESN